MAYFATCDSSGVYVVDTLYYRPLHTACYVVESQGELALFDCGVNRSVAVILDFLKAKGFSPEQVRYVIPSHVHLDHAGGTGQLIQHLPNATVRIHPSGEKHLLDPSQLIAGTMGVYGEKFTQETYGVVQPIEPDRIAPLDDGAVLTVGHRSLEVIYSPGHAWHHLSLFDSTSGILLAGDSMGARYNRNADIASFLFPITPPSQFKPEVMIETIKKQHNTQAKFFALAHFDLIPNDKALINLLVQRIEEIVSFTERFSNQCTRIEVIHALKDKFRQWLGQQMAEPQLSQVMAFCEPDMFISGSGVAHWLQKQAS